VVVIPTNRELIRYEHADVVYRTEREKFNAAIEEIKEYHLRGQPVLVGTIAIENRSTSAPSCVRQDSCPSTSRTC